jgi:hypothetical protein
VFIIWEQLLSLITVTPDKSELMGARDLSQNIIQELMKAELLNVVGIGNSITLAIAAVDVSRNIANVNIQSISLDYIPLTTTYAPEAIFFELSKKPSIFSLSVKNFEAQLVSDISARTIGVRRGDRIETVTNLILWKLNKCDKIKVMASGFAIMTAIRSTLQVITSGITREQVGISAITIDSVERRPQPDSPIIKRIPAIQIYLEKGKETEYPTNHKEIIEKVTAR